MLRFLSWRKFVTYFLSQKHAIHDAIMNQRTTVNAHFVIHQTHTTHPTDRSMILWAAFDVKMKGCISCLVGAQSEANASARSRQPHRHRLGEDNLEVYGKRRVDQDGSGLGR